MSGQAIASLVIVYLGSILLSAFIAWNPDGEMGDRHYAITILLVIMFLPIIGLPFLWAIGKTREQMEDKVK
jgi:hypothetical protein